MIKVGRWFLLLAILLLAWPATPAPGSQAEPPVLEELQYRVDVWVWRDVARARATLKGLGSGRYLAEISGEARGLLDLLSGHRRDSYQTEMICRRGRLLPVVYREESSRRGKRRYKEYRFDYARGRLEMWKWKEGRGLTLTWDTPLKEPVYDPLSAFYNYRLGLLGPLKEGETLKVAGIPHPEPEEIEIRTGPMTSEGRQVMVSILNRAFEDERGLVFVYFDDKGAPTRAWTRVLRFGKILGQLLPVSEPLKGGLPEFLP